MSTHVLQLKSMTLSGCLDFLAGLEPVKGADHYVLDLQSLGHVSPFGMLMCSLGLRRFRARLPECQFDVQNWEPHGYPAHMGFFKAFGAELGKAPGEAAGNKRYLPVTILSMDELRAQARRDYLGVHAVIERRARDLAELLVQSDTGDLVTTLSFSMTELFRNVMEHSGAEQLGYCAQFWPTRDVVEVGVVDVGMGLRAALSANPHLNIVSDSHAVHLAVLPGVSGTAYQGQVPRRRDVWANTGYGLYMTSGICREGGSFFLCSGAAGVRLRGPEKQNFSMDFAGTAIRLRVHPSRIPKLSTLRPKLIAKGEAMARKIKGTVPGPAGASQMVREAPEA